MKKYIPLNQTQCAAINKLGYFFDPAKEGNQTIDSNASSGSKYIRATDLLNPQQKEALEKHEENIQIGFEKYSAY